MLNTMNGHEGVRVNGNREASFAYAFFYRRTGLACICIYTTDEY